LLSTDFCTPLNLQVSAQATVPPAHFPAKAKRIIFLFMQGGPSQLDLFDPKEFIQQRHGHPIDSPLSKNILQVGTEKFLALGTAVPVRPAEIAVCPFPICFPVWLPLRTKSVCCVE
jgi:hypothetical protein